MSKQKPEVIIQRWTLRFALGWKLQETKRWSTTGDLFCTELPLLLQPRDVLVEWRKKKNRRDHPEVGAVSSSPDVLLLHIFACVEHSGRSKLLEKSNFQHHWKINQLAKPQPSQQFVYCQKYLESGGMRLSLAGTLCVSSQKTPSNFPDSYHPSTKRLNVVITIIQKDALLTFYPLMQLIINSCWFSANAESWHNMSQLERGPGWKLVCSR